MMRFISYVQQHWPSLVLLLGSCSVVLYMIFLRTLSTRGKEESAWRKRVKDSVPASTSSPTATPAMPRTMKTSTALKILSLLIIILPAVGYEARDLVQFYRTGILFDVSVLRQEGQNGYWMQTKNGQAFKAKFCPGAPTFQSGSVIRQVVYENVGQCLNITENKTGWMMQRGN